MNIQRLPVTQIVPAPYNPRRALKPGDARFEKLARSLNEFDLVQPLVWNSRTGHLVGGHQRLEVLKHRGWSEVDCVVVDLTLEREKALNVTLNNAEVGGDWELDRLAELLADLHELPDFDATLTGFDERQLTDLLMRPMDDDFEEVDEKPDVVTATLEIPHEAWAAAQTRLNQLLSEAPSIRLHVSD
ncbi:Nucleoid occlusion protein [Caulifigura coniformis]|uniref:Nucleoid occlusion protein n=1 Tax=Caulifigura coniformis TaxID=2527983 RepID=A0A517S7R6_9PLAN|nr:ParB N-terminal domain-containing protein [Caulifigura coniformis]QDT52149.1 Nucleoid occlusion protein [Caulifigura coniformis]